MSEPLEPGKAYWIPIENVVTGRYKIRDKIEGPEFEELKQSMAERGQLQPVVVQSTPGSTTDHRVVLFIGERRVKAAQELGWSKIWCTPVHGGGDFSNHAAVLVENIQRKNLAPLEEARAIRVLTGDISFEGENLSEESKISLTQEEIAKGLGKSQSYVSECLAISGLTDAELSQLSPRDKLQKKKLLQLVKSKSFDAKKPPTGRPSEPFSYVFKRKTLILKGGRLDLDKADDLNLFVAKMEELIKRLKEKRYLMNNE